MRASPWKTILIADSNSPIRLPLSHPPQQDFGVGTWWLRMVTAHYIAGTNASLKESIQQDFLAWCLLGSFISSIAFSAIFNTPSLEGVSKVVSSWVQLESIIEPIFSLKLLEQFLNWFDTDMMNALSARQDKPDEYHKQLEKWEAAVIGAIAKTIFTTAFMTAAVKSIKGVIAGTFKYLLFVSVPPGHVVKTICSYLSNGFSSSKKVQGPDGEAMPRPPPGLFESTLWDHVSSSCMPPTSLILFTLRLFSHVSPSSNPHKLSIFR